MQLVFFASVISADLFKPLMVNTRGLKSIGLNPEEKPIAKLFDLSERAAVVNGGSVAVSPCTLAQAEAVVAVLARNEEKNQRVMGELQALGVPALAVRVDVTERGQLQPALEKVEETLGLVSILVNNVGMTVVAGALDHSITPGLLGNGLTLAIQVQK